MSLSNPSSSLYVGLASSIIASCLFALLPWYVHLYPVTEYSGNEFAAHRIIWSAVLMVFALTIARQLPLLISHLKDWRAWPRVMLGSILVGVQFWLFIWAPANGYTLPLALGYFSLPLVLVLIGRFFYNETLSRLQWVAVCLAGMGVAYAYIKSDGLSWIVLVVALAYPLYFVLRRHYPLPSHIAFSLDNFFLLPIALAYLYFGPSLPAHVDFVQPPLIFYIGLGVAGAVPMLLFLLASRRLTMSLFGLMSYLEPVLVFIVGWFLGERLEDNQWPTYIFIVMAVVVLGFDGIRRVRKKTV